MAVAAVLFTAVLVVVTQLLAIVGLHTSELHKAKHVPLGIGASLERQVAPPLSRSILAVWRESVFKSG